MTAWLRRVEPWLTWLPWVVIVVGLVASRLAHAIASDRAPAVLFTVLIVFFVVVTLQLLHGVARSPGRRTSLVLLLAAIVAWALGSASVNAARVAGETRFPAPGEWLFLLSYVGFAAYLVRDVERSIAPRGRSWLDVVIICGGTICFSELLLVLPIQLASGQTGLSLQLALIYPLADVALAVLALGQALRQQRRDRIASTMLVAGFILLAVADSALALQTSAMTYDFSDASNVLWGAAFALIVAAAVRPRPTVLRAVPQAAGQAALVLAGVTALAALVVRPGDSLAVYVLPPAVVTLIASAGRLGLALRDASRASEAFALSTTDDLTLLPNRRAARAWLREAVTAESPVGLLLLDLDGFKEVNDSLGHAAGDTVLTLVAHRLVDSVGPDVRVARIGGDEFAIVIDGLDEIELMEAARDLLDELAKPVVVEGLEFSPAGSIGVTVTQPGDVDDIDVIRRADVAMYQAKSSGIDVALYDAELDEFSRSRLELTEDLRRGIDQDQIELWYQPQIDVATMEVAGLEALVRWRHPEHGMLSPVSFFPAARRAGLMSRLSEIVAAQAVSDLRARSTSDLDLRVAINCAPPELLGPTFLPVLYALLEAGGVARDRLVLEVTEDSFLADPQQARDALLDVRSHGIQVSIDDYGTGFSSLTYLRNLPVQELKIDRTLIANVHSDRPSRMIVASTVQLAHALGLRTVAEGVENADDLVALVDLGVDVVQGYHLAPPMASADLDRWLVDRADRARAHRQETG